MPAAGSGSFDSITQTKICSGCVERKAVTEFYVHKRGRRVSHPDPYAHQCKACMSAYWAARYQNDPSFRARIKARGSKKSEAARLRAQAKYRTAEYLAKSRERQRRPDIKARKREWSKAYGQRPEVKERAKISVAKRRARKSAAGGSFTAVDIANINKMQRGRCAICRCRLKPDRHIDHIIPIRLGGSSNPDNIQLLCPTCNHAKHGRDPIDYMQSLGRLL